MIFGEPMDSNRIPELLTARTIAALVCYDVLRMLQCDP